MHRLPDWREWRELRRTYIVESRWSWDSHIIEYSTCTFEKSDAGFEELLNPKIDFDARMRWVEKAKSIAYATDGSTMGKARLTAIHVVVIDAGFLMPSIIPEPDSKADGIHFELHTIPMIIFDHDGKPEPCKNLDHYLTANHRG